MRMSLSIFATTIKKIATNTKIKLHFFKQQQKNNLKIEKNPLVKCLLNLLIWN